MSIGKLAPEQILKRCEVDYTDYQSLEISSQEGFSANGESGSIAMRPDSALNGIWLAINGSDKATGEALFENEEFIRFCKKNRLKLEVEGKEIGDQYIYFIQLPPILRHAKNLPGLRNSFSIRELKDVLEDALNAKENARKAEALITSRLNQYARDHNLPAIPEESMPTVIGFMIQHEPAKDIIARLQQSRLRHKQSDFHSF